MANTIGRAGSDLNIRLGQSPDIKDPALNSEFQQVFNALHLLSQYMGLLRENLESAPGQTPAESVRFRRTYWAPALQDIAVGAICSAYGTGIVNGVATNLPASTMIDPVVSINSTGSRSRYGLIQQQHFVALTAATAGQLVNVGVGPGIIQVAGAKCGKIIWGVAAQSVNSYRQVNTVTQFTTPSTLVNNGGLYFENITGIDILPSVIWRWEGYWLPGYPNDNGGTFYYSRAYLYPVGVCVADNYVLFCDFKRSDPLPDRTDR